MKDEYLHPYSAHELLKLIDKARPYARSAKRAHREKEDPSPYSVMPAYDFFVSSSFEKGLKQLKIAHQTEGLDALRTAIVELSATGMISNGSAASPDDSGIIRCRLAGGDYRLIYGIIPSGNRIVVSIEPSDKG